MSIPRNMFEQERFDRQMSTSTPTRRITYTLRISLTFNSDDEAIAYAKRVQEQVKHNKLSLVAHYSARNTKRIF